MEFLEAARRARGSFRPQKSERKYKQTKVRAREREKERHREREINTAVKGSLEKSGEK